MSNVDSIDNSFLLQEAKLRKGEETDLDFFIQGLIILVSTKSKVSREYNNTELAKFDKAIELFDKAIEAANILEKNNKYLAEYHNYKGLCFKRKGDFINAIINYEEAFEKLPYEKPYYNLSCVYGTMLNNIIKGHDFTDYMRQFSNLLNINIKDKQELINCCHEQAIKALKDSLVKDSSNYITALADPNLENLRSNTAFIKLIEEFAAKHHGCNKFVIETS